MSPPEAPLVDRLPTPCWLVAFTNRRTEAHDEEYDRVAARMVALAREQPGFLGVEAVRDAQGVGITLSYWRDRASISAWKAHLEHGEAQRAGNDRFYARWRLRVCEVVDERGFDAD